MYVYQKTEGVVVQAPAKLNLFLELLGKRPDGYHEIETLMVPISWYDTVLFHLDPNGGIRFRCKVLASAQNDGSDGSSCVPEGADNLVVQAVALLRKAAGIEAGAQIELVKRIPPKAGLGGGSSDAAAALVGANLLWKLYWPTEALLPLAAQLGSDVPFFLAGGPAICRGRGELVQPIRLPGNWHFVVVHPSAGLSTAEVYRHCQIPESPRCVEPIQRAWENGNKAALGELLWNRLQPTAEKLCPWISRLRECFAQEDVLGHQLTGSGTGYFALCRHARHARRLAQRLHATGLGTVVAVHSCR
ncbi:MAG: 4-(cytidine 5'-diphospho)-2-C-methyl-D-erythritol kinase [Thermoguttaceae bacterium]|nr:4-(cytidine 5'-diphospho)-2-C-methyl-D-erythritol kinase [Thermoguttaceae bacterium]MDW8039360.1 4-(cytidine 5'-diphospho)-2-C-methyl-D-erythritol kinase [Thermoguttaceae bacterium]